MSYTVCATSEDVKSLPGRVAYAIHRGTDLPIDHSQYVYVIGVFGESVLAVTFESRDGDWVTRTVSLPTEVFTDTWSYTLADLPDFVAPLERHFQSPMANDQTVATEPQNGVSEASLEQARAEGKAEGRREAERQFEAWKRQTNELAIEYANDNGLCHVFDQFMESVGLEGRSRDYDVTVEVIYRTTVTVEATDADSAAELVAENLSDYWSPQYEDPWDITIQDVESS